MGQSGARFRFVTNGCPPEGIALLREFAEAHPDRIVEVFEAREEMGAHGVALDLVMESRDDGEWFCLVDPDIKARGPFLPEFRELLERHDGVGSGRGVWCESDVVPAGHPGVAGEHFFREDGFVFGSPHFSIYRRAALDDTIKRWGVTFRTAGPDIPEETQAVLHENGHDYVIYDTGKVLNIMFQQEHSLVHYEHPQLMHIGGMSHYLEPGGYVERDGQQLPEWVRYPSMAPRFAVARFTADLLSSLVDERPPPAMPTGLEPELEARLDVVRGEIVDLVSTYRTC
jgi:hypothetical protein